MDYVDAVEQEIVEGMEDADHDHASTLMSMWRRGPRPTVAKCRRTCGAWDDDHDHSGETRREHAAHLHMDDDHISGETPEGMQPTAMRRDTQLRGSRTAMRKKSSTTSISGLPRSNAMKLVDVIGDTLAEADPAHADTLSSGAENYKRTGRD